MRKVLWRQLFFHLQLYHSTLFSLSCVIPPTTLSIPAPAGTSCCPSLFQTFNLWILVFILSLPLLQSPREWAAIALSALPILQISSFHFHISIFLLLQSRLCSWYYFFFWVTLCFLSVNPSMVPAAWLDACADLACSSNLFLPPVLLFLFLALLITARFGVSFWIR